MVFIRHGPRFLFLRSAEPEKLARVCRGAFDAAAYSFDEALARSDEDTTLVFLTPPGLTKTRVSDALTILLAPVAASIVLTTLFQRGVAGLLENAHLGPGSIILRVIGGGAGVVEELAERYAGACDDFEGLIEAGDVDDTIVGLTNAPLNRVLPRDAIIDPQLLVKRPSHRLYPELRNRGTLFITHSLDRKEWYEFRVNIYDAAERYEEHYRRIIATLTDLEAGFVLGESWTRDHALVLLSVPAYQLRLFSLFEPREVKRILVGLEYDERGRRLVDIDVYYRNRKISYNDKGVRRYAGETRLEIRRSLFERLSAEASGEIRGLERRLRASDE